MSGRGSVPGALSTQFDATRMAMNIRESEHALDETFEDSDPCEFQREASSLNTADDAADLNIIHLSGNHVYEDIAGQDALKANDKRPDFDRSFRRLVITIFRGRAMPIGSLTVSVVWCVIIVIISYLLRRDYTDSCRQWCTPIAVDSDALSYVGFALFLLTSFRVQEAYGRYMEAARVWTNISGTITSFAKYVMQAFPEGMIHKGDRERILSFLVAFPVALKRELRNERDLSELKTILMAKDLARLQNSDSMSGHCLYILSGYLLQAREKESHFPQTFIVHMIRWIADLAGSADICMQIKTMPAPYSYVTSIQNFGASELTITWTMAIFVRYCFQVLHLFSFFFGSLARRVLTDMPHDSLPLAIVEFMGWLTIPIVAFISYGILGVVCNAAELEDPFGSDYNDLPLGKMSQRIQEQVFNTFQVAQKGLYAFAPEVQDDVLLTNENHWLYPTPMRQTESV